MGLALLLVALLVLLLLRAAGASGVVALIAGAARLGATPSDPIGAVVLAVAVLAAGLVLRSVRRR